MAIEAPGHAQRFLLPDNLKLRYVPMTTFAANSYAQMSAVIEIRVIRELMNPGPSHGGFLSSNFLLSLSTSRCRSLLMYDNSCRFA